MAHSKGKISDMFRERFGPKRKREDEIAREVRPIMEKTYKSLGIDLSPPPIPDFSMDDPFGLRYDETMRRQAEDRVQMRPADMDHTADRMREIEELMNHGQMFQQNSMNAAGPQVDHVTYDDLRNMQQNMGQSMAYSRQDSTDNVIFNQLNKEEDIHHWLREHSLQPHDMFHLIIQLLRDQIEREQQPSKRETTLEKINKELKALKD